VKRSGRGASKTASTLIGCAGWALNREVATSFPEKGSHLERYAQIFPCVEINSSFYRSHQPKTYARWAQRVPDAFRFSVKMPRTITHQLRLRCCEEFLHAFLEEVACLGSKLGCILVQLPPSLALDAEEAIDFFAALRRCTSVAVACEPRHASWFTSIGASVLRDAGIALVQAHPPPIADVGDRAEGTAPFYIRLHGAPKIYYSAYDYAFLEAVAVQMRRAREQSRNAWCIFDNTAQGAAVPNALSLMKLIA
jgi:uncharacterized protein YecE (DUF72 family)